MRKASAHEKLWEAQCGFNYINPENGLPSLSPSRQKAYSLLNEAERYIREASDFKENVTTFDYNGDGLNEYVCQMDKYFAVVSLKAGSITDLNVIASSGNYAASLSCIDQFDGYSDNRSRGFFVEHLFDDDDMTKYIKDEPVTSGIFSRVQFSEKKFDSKRKDIQLEGYGEYSSLTQGVRLRKNYIATSSGMVVQYILKNESPIELKGYFVVECNFAQTEFSKKIDGSQYNAEFILDSNKTEIKCDDVLNVEKGVSYLQVNDNANGNSFVFEPNEDSGLCYSMLTFNRPVSETQTVISSRDSKYAMYWYIDLSAGMEIEKTINFSIIPVKKKNKK